jgi:Flp pilus assembly protein CpaB
MTTSRWMSVLGVLIALAALALAAVRLWSPAKEDPAPAPPMKMVLVAAKDLPVGTTLTRDRLQDLVKRIPAEAVTDLAVIDPEGLLALRLRPPQRAGEVNDFAVTDPEALLDKHLTRPLRAGEVIDTRDLCPAGYDLLPLPLDPSSVLGSIGPGSRMDVKATHRAGGKWTEFRVLSNVLVLDLIASIATIDLRRYPPVFGFAATHEQEELFLLAQARGCKMTLVLRRPGAAVPDPKAELAAIKKLLLGLPVPVEVAPPPRPVER